ncbi:MAG: hypothetical protein KatS3mg102_0937 [Planctomycetota bacterium]|nr:MAG: hypothetical protein KatS3mg102_0937 [Planctomycetota bacterium]
MAALLALAGSCGQTSRAQLDQEAPPVRFALHSAAFADGERIPQHHTCEGEDLSPPLRWSGVPSGTRSFALVCEDPDAPGGLWVHWVLFDLPADSRELAAGLPKTGVLASGARQGLNDFGRLGYDGPCPPRGHGPHRYVFRLFALEAPAGLRGGATRKELLAAIEGHVLGEARLTGTYERK